MNILDPDQLARLTAAASDGSAWVFVASADLRTAVSQLQSFDVENANLRSLLSDTAKNTNLRHHPELTLLSEEVNQALT